MSKQLDDVLELCGEVRITKDAKGDVRAYGGGFYTIPVSDRCKTVDAALDGLLWAMKRKTRNAAKRATNDNR